jgi:hypothetical protein
LALVLVIALLAPVVAFGAETFGGVDGLVTLVVADAVGVEP